MTTDTAGRAGDTARRRHPDFEALSEHLAIHPPLIREEYETDLLMMRAGALGVVWVQHHDVQMWLHRGAERDERNIVLAAAHDALCDPARWGVESAAGRSVAAVVGVAETS